jgi:hypothetical protein
LQNHHCQCFAFFINAKQSIEMQVFCVQSETKRDQTPALFSFAVFCPIMHPLNCCILHNLQTSKN